MRSKVWGIAISCAAVAACGGQDNGEGNESGNAPAPVPANASEPQTNPVDAAESIKTRQNHYKAIGKSMKGISDELKKDAPDVAAIQKAAATINQFAPQIQNWFPEGSGAEAGVKTEARAEIWSKPAEFRQAAADLVAAAARFNAIAQSGDLAAIRAGVKPLGAACKACHEKFRVED